MSNTILTKDEILRKALQVLHAKLNFIGSINRTYDNQFAWQGGTDKIGESLRIRLPEKFTVTDGAILDVQGSTEQSTTMTVSTRKHVGMSFTQQDLTMSIDDFTERKIVPAMSVLASSIEADALSMVKDIYNSATATAPGNGADTLADYLNAKVFLNRYLAPKDQNRTALIDSGTSAGLVDALKGLFQDSSAIAAQYREGVMGRTGGYTFAENDLLPTITTGSRSGTILTNGASHSGSTIAIDGFGGATQTVKKGEVFTIEGIYAVHPETKQAYDHLQQFTVTADTTASGSAIAALPISPAIVTSGAYQNVSTTVGDGKAITFLGSASTAYGQNVCFHKDAFAFVSADLLLPGGVDFAARKVMDGISMTIVRDYDINNATMPCRIDVLYGYKTVRPELACRVWK